jgi:predicted TPR repeat methyltransferase
MTSAPNIPPDDDAPAAETAVPEVMTPDEALAIAQRLHQSGRFEVAEALYGRILAIAPEHPAALHYLGILCHQTGRPDQALRLIGHAAALTPDDAAIHNNLGNMLAEQNRPQEAAAAYRAALSRDPAHADALNNLGAALRLLDSPDEAEACYRGAIAANPKHQAAYDNLGRLLTSRNRVTDAILCHARALALQPRNAATRRLLVAAYAAVGERDAALACLQAWLAESPDDPVALHLMAAISGRDVPDRASNAFIETTFDRFASSFDAKLAKLDYRVPERIAAAVASALGEARADRAILDAGCGTGLCGPLLAPFAADLTGIDLSVPMLRQAAVRGVYAGLYKAELTAYLRDNPDRFDLVVAADTFCYFGALYDVCAAAGGALRAGGWLIFSIERDEEAAEVRLNPHGRYSHTAEHVAGALRHAGLGLSAMHPATLRKEKGEDVAGLIVTARKGQ